MFFSCSLAVEVCKEVGLWNIIESYVEQDEGFGESIFSMAALTLSAADY
jgi:hypothetical protein